MTSLTIDQLAAGYTNKPIIHNLTVEIPEKKITTLIGPNGCGKSTLLKSIARILKIQKGTILLDGQDIYQLKTKQVAKKMALLSQSMEPPAGLTIFEVVSYGRFPYQSGFGHLTKLDLEKINWAIEVTSLTAIKEQTVDTLSGGQRQRTWIAMILAQDTDIIILDEPTTYLDLAHQLDILLLLQKLNQEEGRTIVMALHDLNHASRFSDHIIAMKNGDLVAEGSPKRMMTVPYLRETFEIDPILVTCPFSNNPICLSYDMLKKEHS